MIRLASVIEQFERDFLKTYQGKILPSHKKALTALKICRTEHSPKMLMSCSDCDHQAYVPHSCGHGTARIASIMNPNSGLSVRFKNKCRHNTS